VAEPHSILITWATITEGGVQVNALGQRFHNEAEGYSEAAARVVAQPGGIAFQIFDERIAGIARQFEDFCLAEAQGAVLTAETVEALAERLGLPPAAVSPTLAEIAALKRSGGTDRFGRNFTGAPQLAPPFRAVKVRGALFHTQGGLVVDATARVLRRDGTSIRGLLAAGGAACGVSGPEAAGYLSGNGLLTAVALGAIAGRSAAKAYVYVRRGKQ
jgi:fumarate reductase flavoprotein subunit